MEQAGFDAYTGTADAEDRPDEEASAIAGEASDTPRIDVEESALPAADGRLEIAVTQIDYTVTTVGGEERPLIHVFGRTAEDTPEHVRVHGFRPYFYVPAASVDVSTLEELDGITGWDRTDEAGEPFESIRGESLLKVYGRTPRDVGEVRDRFDHYEADILFPNRFLIDKGITSGLRVPERRADDGVVDVSHEAVEPVEASATLRVNTFDIEVDDRSGFPEDGEEEILCVASHDSYRDEYVSWLYRPPDGVGEVPTTLADHDLLDGDGAVEVRAFDSEEAMLEAFIEYLRETDPDLLNGWNFADFDAPYLIDRLKRLDAGSSHDLDYNRLSRVDEVWESDWQGPNIKGRIVFDLLYAYQRTQFSELDSYRLDAVAEQELGVGKERYAGAIGDLWETDPERLLEYNVRDVELCVEIDRKQGIIPFWEEVASFVGCKLEDATTPGDAVDMYVLHKAHGKFALPSKGQQEGEDFEGGAVFDPITGVREMVSVLDLACFSGDTELVTPEGVRQITDIGVGDEVYTLNPQTFECEVKQVTDTHTYENTYGRLHHLSGTTHDLKVTENHRFLISKKRGWNGLASDDFEFSEYRDIPRTERFAFPIHEPMAGSTPETFSLVDEVDRGSVVVYSEADLRRFRNRMPDTVTGHLELMHGSSAVMGLQKKVGKYLIPVQVYRDHRGVIDRHADDVYLKYAAQHRETPLSFDMEDWLEFLGWYVTEGSLNSAASSVTLHQSNGDGRYTIRSLLDRMGLNYSVSEDRFTLSNRLLHDWLESNCGKGYANKRLPEWVFELDASLLETLVETMIEGDGEWSKEGLGKFWTKSDGLKQDIARCAVRCGHKPTVTKQQDGTWYVAIGKWGSFNKSVNETVEDHDGKVYCVTAEDNHVVLAGRNGHFQWVGQSLYPMAMVTLNASPETKVDPETYDGETYVAPNGQHFRKAPDGIMREMVDELLSEREAKKGRRDDHDPGSPEYARYDRQQAAVKVIMNSLYGVSGWERFRLYDRESAAAVTATGREVIEFTAEAAAELDKEVIYGDTDSVMLGLHQDLGSIEADVDVTESMRAAHPEMDDDELREVAVAIDISFDIEDHINGRYDAFAREELNAEFHRFEIEFEKLYRRFLQAGKKKRYAGHIIWKEGNDVDDIDITGFEYKRSDIAPITKRVQREVIERIVRGEDLDDVIAYVREVIDAFEAGEVDLEEIAIPGGIGKRLDEYDTDTAQVRGAKYANLLLGTNFGRGSKPKRLYLAGVHPGFFERFEADHPALFGGDNGGLADDSGLTADRRRQKALYQEFKTNQDVICFEYDDQLPEAFEVDYEKMLDRTVKGPIARILEALDVSWEEVRSGQEQTGLGQYM